MFFKIPLVQLPEIEETYEIERKTVWRSVDRRNILLFIINGTCQIEIDRNYFILNKGDVFLIPAGIEYIRRPIGTQLCRLFYAHFTTASKIVSVSFDEAKKELCDEMARLEMPAHPQRPSRLPSSLYLMQHTSAEEDFEQLFSQSHQILAHRASDSHIGHLLSSLCLLEFLASISLRIVPASQDKALHHELPFVLRQALSYIRQNYDQRLSTGHICTHCHISPQHLIRLFKKHLGVTPLQYITNYKMSQTIELLRHSELSVQEIAASLGYDNTNYFTRLFAREEGYSPTEFRERVKSYDSGEGVLRKK